ncbi:kelch-like protein 35 [Sphaerodactylus townsendi]|uniref:kelch-like protein 35 n=1 Tax=Sphaerodactylus townsendi TaxID=933632 RepID=UPI0020264323|nr:kelch-like protein 35 [Sphaerodactylus townsendi]
MHRRAKEESSCETNCGAAKNTPMGERKEKPLVKHRHAEQILQALDHYRKEGVFTDVVLMMDGQEFPCHHATLSANSAYFRAMFASGLKAGRQDVVNLQNISASTMGLILDYMHGKDVVIQEDNVEGLLKLSDLLQISKLQEACINFLEDQLHPSNCFSIKKLAENFCVPFLVEKSERLILGSLGEVSRHEEFLDLEARELAKYLAEEQLAVLTEEVVFEVAMRWVRHDASARKGVLRDLLQCVRLPLLDPCYFVEKVEMDELIRASKECLPLLREARKAYVLGTEVGSLWSRPRRFMELAETIVVVGGCNKKGRGKLPFVDMFHPASGQWKPLSTMPGYTKSEFATCTLKNDMYISGGHINSSEVWTLSPKLNTWIKVACLKKGRWRHKMVAAQGKIYAVGGYDSCDRLASVECYDPFYNTWTPVAPLVEAISSAAVASCLGQLYVIGGAVDDSSNTNKVQCYDPATNQWTLLSPAPFSQRCINAVTLNNLIYVVGGLLNKIFCYDPQKDTWSEVAYLPGPLESCGVATCAGKIYILGGRDENGEDTEKVFAFDVATGKVEPQPPLQRCTSYHGCVTVLRHITR